MASVVPRAWTIQSFDDVKRLWFSVRSVPMRPQGREHFHEERHYLGLYLLALGTYRLLGYPFQVEKGESPDFMVTWSSGEVTGLEITRATTQRMQRARTEDQREYLRREAAAKASGKSPEPVSRLLSRGGLIGDKAENDWCSLFQEATETKLKKLPAFRPASRHDLVIYDDTPLPAVDRHKVVAALRPWVSSLVVTTPTLGTISLIISLDVLFDLGGSAPVLPYIEWNALEVSRLDELSDLS
jgi:hypothetical protein